MESVKPSSAAVTPSKKLARGFTKVLHLRALINGIASVDHRLKKNVATNLKDEGNIIGNKTSAKNWSDDDEEFQERIAAEAILAKLFASISTVKAAYAQLQHSQSPFDPDGIEAADLLLVSELKNLSELKQCYLKKQFDDPSPQTAILAAELKELQGVIKTYEITANKLESQARLKDSEVMFLKEKLEEDNKHNRSIEKRLNQSGLLDNLHVSGLSPSHFITVLRQAVRSVRNFVRLIVGEMRSAGWDINAAVDAAIDQRDVVYRAEDHKCYAFESFVCRVMFDSFHLPNFESDQRSSTTTQRTTSSQFFTRFNELRSVKSAKDFLAEKPRSSFARFCRIKYLRLVHPKMESSFFGNLNQRSLLMSSGGNCFPDTAFFASFAEMAKRVYLLHCLAFSFEPEASIFQAGKGCRFSDVYMESVNDDDEVESDDPLVVGFTVVPGFRIGKTVIQCQVYLSQSQHQTKVKNKLSSTRQR